jgi:hypothetical protein
MPANWNPAITWNGEEVWHWEQAYADARGDLPATVLLSAGELEAADVARRYALESCQAKGAVSPRALRSSPLQFRRRFGYAAALPWPASES